MVERDLRQTYTFLIKGYKFLNIYNSLLDTYVMTARTTNKQTPKINVHVVKLETIFLVYVKK